MKYCVFFFKQRTANDMRISDWSSDVCSSDLDDQRDGAPLFVAAAERRARLRLEPAAVEQAREIVGIDLAAELGDLVDRDRDHQADRRDDRHHRLAELDRPDERSVRTEGVCPFITMWSA